MSFKNKSENKTKFLCDHCGKSADELWEDDNIEGQYCFKHFRDMHDDPEAFDEWCDRFGVEHE